MKNLLLVGAIIAVILVAGSAEYTENVVYNMPNCTYKCMKENGWSDKKIASEYQKNKAHWDSLGEQYLLIHGED